MFSLKLTANKALAEHFLASWPIPVGILSPHASTDIAAIVASSGC
jgi:hypothetical protein